MHEELVKQLREEASSWCTNCCYRAGDCICAAPDDRKKDCDVYTKLQAADAVKDLSRLIDAQLDIIKQYQGYLSKTAWIKFTLRPLTEEEQNEHPDWCYILDCHTPDPGQEILVSNGRYVWTDTFYEDGDQCYLDGGSELEDCWWQPMPEPPKEANHADTAN